MLTSALHIVHPGQRRRKIVFSLGGTENHSPVFLQMNFKRSQHRLDLDLAAGLRELALQLRELKQLRKQVHDRERSGLDQRQREAFQTDSSRTKE